MCLTEKFAESLKKSLGLTSPLTSYLQLLAIITLLTVGILMTLLFLFFVLPLVNAMRK